MLFNKSNFEAFERRYRANFFNTISGFKSANLIGTVSKNGISNLAVFNSVVHLGANPPLVGFIMRPLTVPRHTYDNIKASSYYTINSIQEDFITKAHQSSAKYEKDESEFEAVGLNQLQESSFPAPYVKESAIRLGLRYRNEYPIEENGTIMIVGEIEEAFVSEEIIQTDGSIDLAAKKVVSISGLDTYLAVKKLEKLPYARP